MVIKVSHNKEHGGTVVTMGQNDKFKDVADAVGIPGGDAYIEPVSPDSSLGENLGLVPGEQRKGMVWNRELGIFQKISFWGQNAPPVK